MVDIKRAKNFYENKLELKLLEEMDEGLFFEAQPHSFQRFAKCRQRRVNLEPIPQLLQCRVRVLIDQLSQPTKVLLGKLAGIPVAWW